MKTSKELQIPYEVFMECATQLIKYGLHATLININSKAGLVELDVTCDDTNSIHSRVLANIYDTVNEYDDMTFKQITKRTIIH